MKRRIQRQFTLVAVAAILITGLCMILLYNEQLQKEVMGDLRLQGQVLEQACQQEKESFLALAEKTKGLRVTLIAANGQVIYDNQGNPSSMGNHGGRPEVKAALEEGEGTSIRNSDTLSRSMFYYAVKQEDGSVLRVARESANVWSLYQSVIPLIIGIFTGLFVLCMVVAHFLTKSLILPVEQMAQNPDHLETIHTYKELMPFITIIRRQHQDIVNTAVMRQEFTANVSHELKTPLTAITGYAELIESGMAKDQEACRFAGEIKENSKRLLVLINDTIRLSELDVTQEELTPEAVELQEVAKDCIRMVQVGAQKAQVTILQEGGPVTVMSSKAMVEEILYNLCDNAVRYNRPGGQVVVGTYEKNGEAFLTVKDNGIGIPKEHQERIFERFYRVDKSRSKQTGGTGLGLAIVKHLVERCHARMQLESEVGIGTRVCVIFPLETPRQENEIRLK